MASRPVSRGNRPRLDELGGMPEQRSEGELFMSGVGSVSLQRAGRAQGTTLMAVLTMPVLALAGLVADLPQLFRVFASDPHHALLVPMVITVPSLCVALFSGLFGAIADFWGRRRLLIIALLAFAVLGLMPLAF